MAEGFQRETAKEEARFLYYAKSVLGGTPYTNLYRYRCRLHRS
ncbi:hypothetical protein [Vibrio diabolicus]